MDGHLLDKTLNREIIATLLSTRMLITMVMGFAAGLPLLLTADVLKFWLRSEGIDLASIGLLSLIGLPYSIKFLWAPLLDRFNIPGFGRRRGWLMVAQGALVIGLLFIGLLEPDDYLFAILLAAIGIACASATQDMVIDAYRREHLADHELAFGSSLYVFGYRIGLIAASGVGLVLADYIGFSGVYLIAAGVVVLLMGITYLVPEPELTEAMPVSFYETVIAPFLNLLQRPTIFWILSFILLYKIGDSMAAAITAAFYVDLGFSSTEVGVIVKGFGLATAIAGGFLGGILLLRISMHSALLAFGVLQMLSTAVFTILVFVGWQAGLVQLIASTTGFTPPSPALTMNLALILVISFENFSSGMGTAAFIGFLGQLTSKKFTATQFALLTALTSIPRVFLGASTGFMAESFGWLWFFLFCTLIAIPGLFIINKMQKYNPT